MITIKSLTKRFGRAIAANDISLDIPEGDSVALWGANGAGKTTIIRCILGLHRYRGKITVAGIDARRAGKRARKLIGYVPQELGFYDDLRASEAIAFFGRLKGLRIPRCDDILGPVGLAGHDRKRIRELSGGMKQRLALAIAMLGDPPVLILDEVTASLDACGREEFVALLSRLSGRGRTMLFASHRVEEVTALSKRVVMLDRGRITAEVPAPQFGVRLGADATLHLQIPATLRARALTLLRANGFAAQMNGIGLLVPVPPTQRAGPFRVLAEGRIQIDDFELIPSAGRTAPALHEHAQLQEALS